MQAPLALAYTPTCAANIVVFQRLIQVKYLLELPWTFIEVVSLPILPIRCVTIILQYRHGVVPHEYLDNVSLYKIIYDIIFHVTSS